MPEQQAGSSPRWLIVNADDLGQDEAFNRGTAAAHDDGIVTSASLMVRWAAAEQAVRLVQERPAMGLGLHVDLGEWTFRDGRWQPLYSVVDVHDEDAVQREVHSQLRLFRELTGRSPTHLDSHQHVHREEPVRGVLLRAAEALGVPLRECGAISYCGSFYGQYGTGTPFPQGITVQALVALIRSLPEGTSELGCHPADGLSLLPTMYRDERVVELASLCHPDVRRAVGQAGVRLTRFGGLPA